MTDKPEIQTNRLTDVGTHKPRRDRQVDRQTDRLTDIGTDKPRRDRQADRQKDSRTGRQMYR